MGLIRLHTYIWCLNYLHVCSIFPFLLRSNEFDDVICDGHKPVHFSLPPRLSLFRHWLQLRLFSKYRSCKNNIISIKFKKIIDICNLIPSKILMVPARLVSALDKASAEETPFPLPDMSSPRSSLENLSFTMSVSRPKKMEATSNSDNDLQHICYLLIFCH